MLVTGGGTGLGKAMAERLLGLGAEVAICGQRNRGPVRHAFAAHQVENVASTLLRNAARRSGRV